MQHFARTAFVAALAAGIPASAVAQKPAAEHAPRYQVIAYVFPEHGDITPANVRANGLTRINYAFANIQNGLMVEGSPAAGANFAALRALKQINPQLEILVSVGGWTWSGGFSDAALTPASRAAFVDSVVAFLRKYQLDGLDIDWEYPGMVGNGNRFRPEDGANFTELLRELRARFNTEEKSFGHPLRLSIAAGSSDEYVAHTELGKLAPYLDTVNLMAYDMYEPESHGTTGNHSPLYADPADPKRQSDDRYVRAFEAAGVPADKLVLGVPFYGHVWANVPPAHHGLFQPGTAAPQTFENYQALTSSIGHGFTRYWDAPSQVPYLYSAQKKQFVSYEDPESLRRKAEYVRQHHLAGMMFWEYFSDPTGTLLRALDNALGTPEKP